MVSAAAVELQCQCCSVFGSAACEYFQKQSMTFFLFGRCKQSGLNLAYNPKQTGPQS
jgi:hypothetical protein